VGLIVAGMAAVAGPGVAGARTAQPAQTCPLPEAEVEGGVEVCVDRGEGSFYFEGESITVCVTANLPVILIFPPPPPPLIRVTGSTDGGPARVLLEVEMHSGQECVTGTVVAAFGLESIRGEAIGDDGRPFASDTTWYFSIGLGEPAGPGP
jgi:hypothetical protein